MWYKWRGGEKVRKGGRKVGRRKGVELWHDLAGVHSTYRVSPTQRVDVEESKRLLCFDELEAGDLA